MGDIQSDGLRVHLAQHGQRYELTAHSDENGRLLIEAIGTDADGRQVAVLSGHVPSGDFGLLADLVNLVKARWGQDGEGQVSVVERQRLAHPDAYRGWTEEQDTKLQQLAARPDASVQGLAAALERSEGAIRSRLRRLRIDELPHHADA